MAVVAQIEAWRKEAHWGPGGAPETFPLRAVLVAIVLVARETVLPMLATAMRDVLFKHISPAMRRELGVPDPPEAGDVKGWDARYRNVRTRLHGMLEVMDPSPYPKNRRLGPEEFAARTRPLSPEQTQEFYERLTWFVNQILDASIHQMPREIRRRWKGSVALDATPIPLFARAEERESGRKKRRKVVVHSTDPDGAWYVRERDHRDPDTIAELRTLEGKKLRKLIWAEEATLVVMGADDPAEDHTFPYLIVGMAPLHKPGHEVGEKAIVALASIRARGHPSRWLGGDRNYTNAIADKFQLPARALGNKVVIDYREDQLGVQDSWNGALLVEGNWYSPGMPQALIDATIQFRRGQIDEDLWHERIAARAPYRLRPKSAPDKEGHVIWVCPAGGPCPMARCDNKPASNNAKTAGKVRIFLTDDLVQDPDLICTQQSLTIPPEAGAKYVQDLQYASAAWQTVYSTLRNTIEGFNGLAKDGGYEALGDSNRRRIRGQAAQSVFVAFLLFGANLRKIDRFIDLSAVTFEGGRQVRKIRRRRTAALSDWLPAAPDDDSKPLLA
jgi:hypothetical protein